MDWEFEGLFEKFGLLVGVGLYVVKKDLENFKEFIEGCGVEIGVWCGDVDV